MVGETATVYTPVRGDADAFGAKAVTWGETTVENVLVAPGRCAEIGDGPRPDGVIVAVTLHFPKTFTGDLEHCEVSVRGRRFRVIGAPQRFADANCPGEWNMSVECEACDG